MTKDSRFRMHPDVVVEPYVRFHARPPLATSTGHRLGTSCECFQVLMCPHVLLNRVQVSLKEYRLESKTFDELLADNSLMVWIVPYFRLNKL